MTISTSSSPTTTCPTTPGTDFIRLLREDDGYRYVPVILLTARAVELDEKYVCDELIVLPIGNNVATSSAGLAIPRFARWERRVTPSGAWEWPH